MQFSQMRTGGGHGAVEEKEQDSAWPLGPREGAKQPNHRGHKSLRGPL